ncbi:membrane-bound acid phosphatase, putative [Bodo saltans]|uniref:Membrane-bound acid phosphatase, putative n=1 Tax=Bodo saltans TaxID=75058 RepID=A0A0S4IXN9_BODSA|nr:membrane-bound acid phosphatase, putative [Bodo saltans]|eukprot:CUG43711.1 membrane-bound acid phosphatase, putative [Bodo saltans]
MNFILFLELLLTAVIVVDSEPLVQIAVLHRHGARQEPIEVGGSMSWANADLTGAGVVMSQQLGKALTMRYGSLINMSQHNVVSQSTDISRTIRTGVGLRMSLGLPDEITTVPFVSHVAPMTEDFMLAFSSNFPSSPVASSYWSQFKNNNSLASSLLGQTNVGTLARFFGAWCYDSVMECALLAEDCVQCRISNGGVEEELLEMFPLLQQLQMMNNKYLFGRNDSSPFAEAGSPGYLLASKWLSDATLAVSGNTTTTVFHYSAHDNTVVGLLSALGVLDIDSDNDLTLWVPRFTQTIIMEIRADGLVTLRQGSPQNYSYGSNFSFRAFLPVNMTCMLPSGSIVMNSSCAIQDVVRFVQQKSAPTAAAIVSGLTPTQCWLPNEYANICSIDDATSMCAAYRIRCPMTCTNQDVGSVLSVVSGECLTFLAPDFGASAVASLTSAAAAIVGGIVIGRLIFLFVAMEERTYPEEKGYMDNIDVD